MVRRLNGAVAAPGPEYAGFSTLLSPRAVIVSCIEAAAASAPPANASVPPTTIPVWLTAIAVPFSAGPVAVAVSVTVLALWAAVIPVVPARAAMLAATREAITLLRPVCDPAGQPLA